MTKQAIITAEKAGAEARRSGKPVEANPYSNRGGGRLYHRAWRRGWYAANLETSK